MNPLKNIFIKKNFLDDEDINLLHTTATNASYKPLKSHMVADRGDYEYHDDEIENMFTAFMLFEDHTLDHINNSMIDELRGFYNKPLTIECCYFYKYLHGGHLAPHADAYAIDNETGEWTQVDTIDITCLIYTNDDYDGGEVVFDDLGIVYKPEPGTFIAFPSDQNYIHSVRPVLNGTRYAYGVRMCYNRTGEYHSWREQNEN